MNKAYSRSLPGRTHFWSHILFSMIALFALPQVQGVEQTELPRLEYQNQSIQVHSARSAFVQQEQLQRIQGVQPRLQAEEYQLFSPHFASSSFAKHAPIRGSPMIS